MNAAALLDHLEGVRQTGNGRWIARCPAHEDRSPSLSIRELDDGRILLHDFAGCDVQSVLSAVGMSLSDLFPEKLGHQTKSTRSRVPLRDLVAMLDHESFIVHMVACDIEKGKTINDETLARLRMAIQRIGAARDEIN